MPDIMIRAAGREDVDELFDLAVSAGPGMTNFPPNKKLLEEKIIWSEESLAKAVSEPGQEFYYFVMQCLATNKVVGCCGIFAQAGGHMPFYNYKVTRENLVSKAVDFNKTIQTLFLVHDYHETSEIATLFLSPDYRKNRNGEFLSRVRFLFMAAFKQRFAEKIIAEMRGVVDSDGISPFWESLGHHFFDMNFPDADRLCAMGKKQFILDLMPKHPVYVPLLSQAAQATLGQAHPHTQPALYLLEKEGFVYEGYIDIFDGGPAVEARLNRISTVERCQVKPVVVLDQLSGSAQAIITNDRIDFKATMTAIEPTDEFVGLTAATAEVLAVAPGDSVRFAEFPLTTREDKA